MHHSQDKIESESLKSLFGDAAVREEFGPTGKFPEGKLDKTDEGEIQFGITHDPATAKVILNFGGPVAWIGMNKAQAFDLARALKKHAHACRDIGSIIDDTGTAMAK